MLKPPAEVIISPTFPTFPNPTFSLPLTVAFPLQLREKVRNHPPAPPEPLPEGRFRSTNLSRTLPNAQERKPYYSGGLNTSKWVSNALGKGRRGVVEKGRPG